MNNNLPEKQGLTVIEAGAVIGIGRSKAYELIRSGILPARKIGARTIILRDDALAVLRSLPVIRAASTAS
jgi:excisionase family DNA binding protein